MFLIDRISCFPHFVGVKEKVDYKEKWRKWDGFKSPGVYIRKGKIIKTRGCVPFTIFQLWWAWAGQRIISFLDSLVVVAAQILIVSLKSLATRLLLYIDFLLYSQLFFCFSPFLFASLIHPQQTSWAFVSYSSSSNVFLPPLDVVVVGLRSTGLWGIQRWPDWRRDAPMSRRTRQSAWWNETRTREIKILIRRTGYWEPWLYMMLCVVERAHRFVLDRGARRTTSKSTDCQKLPRKKKKTNKEKEDAARLVRSNFRFGFVGAVTVYKK